MIITLPWLKEHLKTKANQNEIIDNFYDNQKNKIWKKQI